MDSKAHKIRSFTFSFIHYYSQTDRHHYSKYGIIPKTEGGQIHLVIVTLLRSHEIKLSQKEALLEQRYFTGSTSLLIPNHRTKTCGGPKALTSITIFIKCGVELDWEGGAETLHPANQLGTQQPHKK